MSSGEEPISIFPSGFNWQVGRICSYGYFKRLHCDSIDQPIGYWSKSTEDYSTTAVAMLFSLSDTGTRLRSRGHSYRHVRMKINLIWAEWLHTRVDGLLQPGVICSSAGKAPLKLLIGFPLGSRWISVHSVRHRFDIVRTILEIYPRPFQGSLCAIVQFLSLLLLLFFASSPANRIAYQRA